MSGDDAVDILTGNMVGAKDAKDSFQPSDIQSLDPSLEVCCQNPGLTCVLEDRADCHVQKLDF